MGDIFVQILAIYGAGQLVVMLVMLLVSMFGKNRMHPAVFYARVAGGSFLAFGGLCLMLFGMLIVWLAS